MAISLGKDLGQAQRWFHGLSDETRLQLLELLGKGEQCVCDLTDALDAAQSRLSFHLKTLKDAGLVLNPEVLDGVAEFVAALCSKPSGLLAGGNIGVAPGPAAAPGDLGSVL